MKKCTDFLAALAVILAVTLFVAVLPTEKEGAIYEDTLRLHILANSDTREDQELKLKIRDKLLKKYSEQLSPLGSKDAAIGRILAIREEMEGDINSWITEEGYAYTASVSISEEWYARRDYGDISLPGGYYTSLKVELGDSEGQNWWCVMYPPLCLEAALGDAPGDDAILGYTDEEISLIGKGRYTVKFKLLELTSEIFAVGER